MSEHEMRQTSGRLGRRGFLRRAAAVGVAPALGAFAATAPKTPAAPQLTPVFEKTLCPWTPEKRIPTTGDLLLLWNHVESRSNWPRTPLTAAVSRDEGASWQLVGDVDARSDHDAAYPSVYFQDDEALVCYYTRPTSWARDSEVLLKVFEIGQFYGEDSPGS